MHRCVGNDDFENKKIYEESVRPEGIRKTIAVKEKKPMFELSDVQKRIPTKNLSSRKIRELNTKNENKIIMEMISTIIFLVFFIFFVFIIFS